MRQSLRRGGLTGIALLLAAWSSDAAAQSKEQLIEHYKAQCIRQYWHMRSQGYEAMKAVLRPCVIARVRGHIRQRVVGEIQPLFDRVNKLIDAGNLHEAEGAARHAIARATQLTNSESPAVGGGYGHLTKVLLQEGRFKDAEQSARKAVELVERAFGPTPVPVK
jgi:hypothetical protein